MHNKLHFISGVVCTLVFIYPTLPALSSFVEVKQEIELRDLSYDDEYAYIPHTRMDNSSFPLIEKDGSYYLISDQDGNMIAPIRVNPQDVTVSLTQEQTRNLLYEFKYER